MQRKIKAHHTVQQERHFDALPQKESRKDQAQGCAERQHSPEGFQREKGAFPDALGSEKQTDTGNQGADGGATGGGEIILVYPGAVQPEDKAAYQQRCCHGQNQGADIQRMVIG